MLGISRALVEKLFAKKSDKNQCTAWVVFDGTTTPPTIKDSYNVISVTKIAVGVYDINFTIPMKNINYQTSGSVTDDNSSSGFIYERGTFAQNRTVNKCRIVTIQISGGNTSTVDRSGITFSAIGGI
ncbi:MAG: hypothetical protein R3331_02100 [Sulfurospirillaceae bacterium]|nr:hypothetical protein [Sulfurospirillaceae bacterium]